VSSAALPQNTHDVRSLRRAADHPLLLVFIAVALITRLTFWLYTGRIWEDALISLSPARNVWDGVGLTHHASEPYVYSFTSGLGELILIAGEGFGAGYGLLAMRLASLAAAVAAIIYAYRLCLHLRLHWSAQVFALGFLATDQLHIMFGMSGMETQVAVALALGNAAYFIERRWAPLGITTGLAIICRPEFLLWLAIVAAALALEWREGRRDAIRAFVLPAALMSLPWLLFTTVYYGSPVPHTIVVKSFVSHIFVENVRVSAYLADSWKHIAPFRQFLAFADVPLPESVLKIVVALVLALALAGAVHAVRLQPRMLAVFAFLAGFAVYRVAARVNPYFMWYLPPFTALLALFAACGISWLAARQKALAVLAGCGLLGSYALHLPFSLPLDKRTQDAIETDVRTRIGKELNAMMTDQDAVLLEPLGFIGWEAKNRTIYDVPGLASPKAFASFKRHVSIPGMIRDLSPRFLVQRPNEWADLSRQAPDLAARYEAVRTVEAPPTLTLNVPAASYSNGDRSFTIYRLRPE
jgi:hypothetical protein